MGLTMDYGPFAFMDVFERNHICNHTGMFYLLHLSTPIAAHAYFSDEQGRYNYNVRFLSECII